MSLSNWVVSLCLLSWSTPLESSIVDLHPDHRQFVASRYPSLLRDCLEDNQCHKNDFKKLNNSCWGYEKECIVGHKFGGENKGCPTTKLKDDFWKYVDFGYVKERRQEFSERVICKPKQTGDSLLQCSRFMRYCRASNLYLDFKHLSTKGNDKYREDLFGLGDIGGHCNLDKNLLKEQSEHKSPLQSWYAELQNFSELEFQPLQNQSKCDVVLNETVVFMKMDFGGNMFHHFCDFFNLYVSQHVNNSWFGQDMQIVMWDTSTPFYFDPFAASWKVFSNKPVVPLMNWANRRVCIKDATFPLLPRMRSGMYYNTYVPAGCKGSNLFRAFSEHFLYRMNISQSGVVVKDGRPLIRVTILERAKPNNDRVYRKIVNQADLVKVLREFRDFKVKVVEYAWKNVSFEEQLSITRNSDIFIGMHGAGLTHFLFLPDWAVAFELYNCGDERCYADLARLRGVDYMTWSKGNLNSEPKPHDKNKHHRYGENPKFWNWWFDPRRFRQLAREARERVLTNPLFVKAWKAQANGAHSEKSEL